MSQPSVIMYPFSDILMNSRVSGSEIIEELFGTGQHAFERSQFQEAFSSFTLALKAIDCQFRASVLLGRAMCREVQGNLALALADAKKVVQLSPTWSGGYMYLSRLYSVQCDYAQVLSTLQTGVAKSNKDDPHYEELVYQCASMEAQVKRRNCSLIDRLPVESLINVFSHLDFESRIQSASTCRYWRRFLFEQFPFMWTNVSLQKSHWILKNILSWHSVRMMRISCADAEEALQILVNRNTRGIQVLELYNCNFEAVTLFKMLSLNRYSLQTLTLVATNIKPNVLLGTVFDTIPNLLQFTCIEQAIKMTPWSEDSTPPSDQQHSRQTETSSQSGPDSQQESNDDSQKSTTVRDLSLMQLHVGSGAALNLISRVLHRTSRLKSLTLYEVDRDILLSFKSLRHLSELHLDLAASTATISETSHHHLMLRIIMARVATQLESLVLSGTFIDNHMLSIIANNGFHLQEIKLSYNYLLPDEILRFGIQLREAQRFSTKPLERIELANMYELDEDSTIKLRDDLERACHIKLVTDRRRVLYRADT